MQKEALIATILEYQTEMGPLALKWAKVAKKKFARRFENLELMTPQELRQRRNQLAAIHQGSWTNLLKIWSRLPEAQWETTFALQMKHLPEYSDLRKALVAFKNDFMGKKNAESPT